MTEASPTVPLLRGGIACSWNADGRTPSVPESANAQWTRGESPMYIPKEAVTPRPLPQRAIGARELFKVRFDTEKEVHHVCFVTY